MNGRSVKAGFLRRPSGGGFHSSGHKDEDSKNDGFFRRTVGVSYFVKRSIVEEQFEYIKSQNPISEAFGWKCGFEFYGNDIDTSLIF